MPGLRQDRSMWNGNSTFHAVCAVSDLTVIINISFCYHHTLPPNHFLCKIPATFFAKYM